MRTPKRLTRAWIVVRQNGLQSGSAQTRRAIRQFDAEAEKNINRIYRKLARNESSFSASRGAPIARPGKAPRPIVVADISDRIVQRALLDTLLDVKEVAALVDAPGSFGGRRLIGPSHAIQSAHDLIISEAKYYLKTDIPDFFTAIPRAVPLNKIRAALPDNSLDTLLTAATDVELSNAEDLGKLASLFPSEDTGVAQGCCLSPFLGNVLLKDFDDAMAKENASCLRYIDDILILGSSRDAVHASFSRAVKMLGGLNLRVYTPGDGSDKAAEGSTRSGFAYLGCNISVRHVLPTPEKRKQLLHRVDEILQESVRELRGSRFNKPESYRYSYARTLNELHNMVRAWGDYYQFCNATDVMCNLDDKIDEKITAYTKEFLSFSARNPETRRRALGVHLLADCKRAPIVVSKTSKARKPQSS